MSSNDGFGGCGGGSGGNYVNVYQDAYMDMLAKHQAVNAQLQAAQRAWDSENYGSVRNQAKIEAVIAPDKRLLLLEDTP